MRNDIENFLSDYVQLLRDKAKEIGAGQSNDSFQSGRMFGNYEALSLLKEQALAFGFDLKLVGMDDFDPDSELSHKA